MRWLLLLCLGACPQKEDLPDTPEDTVLDTPDDTVVSDSDSDVPDTDCPDDDGDGASCDDCDDSDPRRFPGARERCNGLDDNCDGGTFDEVETDGVLSCADCAAGGYWGDLLTGAEGDFLAEALRTTASSFSACEYASARAHMFTVLDNDSGWVEGVYTGVRIFVGTEEPDFDIMNTEHSWPGADGGRTGIRECDLHHLFPADAMANNRRGSYPFGEVTHGEEWSDGGSRLGLDANNDLVFEPRASHRGDVARAMLYMSLRHQLPLEQDRIDLFQRWHAEDPPSQAEVERSLAIRARQGNANPFVTCPRAVDGVY